MSRLRAWIVVTPLVAAGTLVAHAVAYRATGTPTGSLHDYLAHAPQLLVLVAVLACALAGLGARLSAPPARAFAALGPLAFLAQEHVERLVHSGQLTWLLTTPAVALGLALQVPVAIVTWLLAGRLLRALAPARTARPPRAHALLVPDVPVLRIVVPDRARLLPARGPPSPLRP